MLKKTFIIMAVFLFPVAVVARVALRPTFPDVSENQWYSNGIFHTSMIHAWIQGYENGYFGVNDPVTRAQLATILTRYDEDRFEKMRLLSLVLCLNKNNFLESVNLEGNIQDVEIRKLYEDALTKLCEPHAFDGLLKDLGCQPTFDVQSGNVEGCVAF